MTSFKLKKEDSRSKKLYSTLKDRIALLEYRPGETLKEDEIVEEFECSRTPVRKAFTLLERDALIERIPKSGTYVTPMGFQDLKELFKIRKHLLPLIAEFVVNNIEPRELDSLEKLVNEMKQEEDPDELIKLDLYFHRHLCKATHNKLLTNTMENIIVKATQVWLFSVDKNLASRFPEDFSRLVNALRKRGKETTTKILVSHSQRTIEHLEQDLKEI